LEDREKEGLRRAALLQSPAQRDGMEAVPYIRSALSRQRSFAKKAQDDKGHVILNEVKNLIPQLLRSFAKKLRMTR